MRKASYHMTDWHDVESKAMLSSMVLHVPPADAVQVHGTVMCKRMGALRDL